MKVAGAVTLAAAAPAFLKAANTDQVKFGVIGTGGRGSYLLKHLTKVDNGRCVAICDVDEHITNAMDRHLVIGPPPFIRRSLFTLFLFRDD